MTVGLFRVFRHNPRGHVELYSSPSRKRCEEYVMDHVLDDDLADVYIAEDEGRDGAEGPIPKPDR